MCVLGVNEVVCGGDAEVERESNFLPPGFFKLLCFFPTGGQTSSSWGRGYDMGHVLRLFTREKSHRNLLSETINNTGSLLFDIYHRTKNV